MQLIIDKYKLGKHVPCAHASNLVFVSASLT